MFEKKAQGALEYLLIIGGAILLVAIVIAVLLNMTSQSKDSANQKFNDFNTLINDVNVANTVSNISEQSVSNKAILVAYGYENPDNVTNLSEPIISEHHSNNVIYFSSNVLNRITTICKLDCCTKINESDISVKTNKLNPGTEDYNWACIGKVWNAIDNQAPQLKSDFNNTLLNCINSDLSYVNCISDLTSKVQKIYVNENMQTIISSFCYNNFNNQSKYVCQGNCMSLN